MSSLQASDAEAAVHAVAPRVSLADIEGAIATRVDLTADKAIHPGGAVWVMTDPSYEVPLALGQLRLLSI